MTNHPEELLSAYIDNELDAADRQVVEKHLSSCAQCKKLVDELSVIQMELSHAYQAIDAPLDLEEGILQALESQTSTPSMTRALLAIPLAGLFFFTVISLVLGPVMVKIGSVLFRFLVVLTYALSSVVTSIPTLMGATIMFAMLILGISGFSLRRLLRTTTH